MISPFLTKLLFARQFSMINGKIEILSKKQILLPSEIILILQDKKSSSYVPIKKAIRKITKEYATKIGRTGEGLLKIMGDIFETWGLGRWKVIDLDNKKIKCIIRLYGSPFLNVKKSKLDITAAIISGMFSHFFNKDVNAKRVSSKGLDYIEYIIS